MQQVMSVPMQVAQQVGQMVGQVAKGVGQLLQGIMQGVQGGVQLIGQMTGGAGQSGEGVGDKSEEGECEQPAAAEGAAFGQDNAERAPEPSPLANLESSAVPDAAPSRHTRSPDPGIVL